MLSVVPEMLKMTVRNGLFFIVIAVLALPRSSKRFQLISLLLCILEYQLNW